MKTGHFNVAPRYTPGSPALVSEDIALRVALQERGSIVHALEGAWGENEQAKANRLGLRGIVEYRRERGSGKNSGWEVIDLCTGEKFFRLSAEALRKHGWRSYADLDGWEKKLVDEATLPVPDPKKAHFKITPGSSGYEIKAYVPEQLDTNVWPFPALAPKEKS
jgi:hypothetical protein